MRKTRRTKTTSSKTSSHGRKTVSVATTAIEHLVTSADRGELVAVIGTGVSMALTNGKNEALSWVGLIKSGFSEGVRKGRISSAQEKFWRSQIGSEDLDDLLSAAEFMGRKLGSPDGELYARWLRFDTCCGHGARRVGADSYSSRYTPREGRSEFS